MEHSRMENLTSIIREKPLWEYKDASYADDWFLVGSYSQFFLILTSYLAFVLKVGPNIMKDRAPFKLTSVLLAYNIVQVAVSAYICKLACGIIYNTVIAEESCIYDSGMLQYKYFYALHVYTLAKLSELLDTIFFVLRKKDRQVSFLHVYHHSAVFFYAWALMSYRKAFLSVTVIGLLNSFVHLIMYSYYALSVFPSLTKYLWWKKYITKIQMIQFAMMIVYTIYENVTSTCKLPSSLFIHMVANISLVFILFADFYRKTYKTPQNAKKK